MKTFNEYLELQKEISNHWALMREEAKKEEPQLSDKSGPGKGKPFNKIGSDEHLAAMQFHSAKFNAFKKGIDNADHVKKAGMDYHTKMYLAHKSMMEK